MKAGASALATFALLLAGLAHADTPRSAVVEQLYRDFPAQSDRSIAGEPPAVLNRYFTPQLTKLIHADDLCARRTHGICKLDFVLNYDSQDPEARDLRVNDDEEVRVRFGRSNGGREETVTIRYRMVRTKAGWRVDDLIYPSGRSLRAILSRN